MGTAQVDRVRRISVRVFLVLAVAMVPFAPSADADPDVPPGVEEIELRLKTAGVDPALRKRIHASIRQGVAYLLKVQRGDGSLVGKTGPLDQYFVAYTALSGLALAHAGYPEAVAGAKRAVDWLAPPEGKPRMKVSGGVYEAGMVALLLKALDTRPEVARKIVEAMVAGQDPRSGWWGYCTPDCRGGRTCAWGGWRAKRSSGKIWNLSTTQYAALALWAGSAASPNGVVEGAEEAWAVHAASLARSQLKNHDWPYRPVSDVKLEDQTGSANSASMAMANLLLARGALRARLAEDVELAADVGLTLMQGRAPLARMVRILDPKRDIDFYGYYALEKACVFEGVEILGGRRWYDEGAKRLLAAQRPTGAWRGKHPGTGNVRDNVLSTSFALLFLLRVSETYRPTTPRDAPRPAPVVTGDGPRPEAPVEEPAPDPDVPLAKASELLDALHVELKRKKLRLPELERAIRAVDAVQLRVVSDGPPDDLKAELQFVKDVAAWRERRDKTLVRAFERCESPERDYAEPAALAAAEAIGRAGAAAAERLRAGLPRKPGGKPEDAPSPNRYDAALSAIGSTGDDGTVKWLTALVTDGRGRCAVRTTRAALLGLTAVAGASGTRRLATFRRLMKVMTPIEEDAQTDREHRVAFRDRARWAGLEARTIDALIHLARDPGTGEPPVLTAEGVRPTLEQFRKWLKKHGSVKRAPWSAE